MRLLFAACLVAGAAHADTLEVLGWSADGAYVALVAHGVGEGSGHPWARLTILDTSKRKSVAEPTKVDLDSEGATEADAVTAVKKRAAEERARLKISAWVPGKAVAHDEKGELREQAGPPIGTLELTATKAGKKQQARPCDEPFVAQRLKLVMHWMDDETPFSILDEKKTPKERACVTACKLGSVFAQAKAAVFILECGIQRFEGPATLSFPVVTKLPYGLDEDLPPQ